VFRKPGELSAEKAKNFPAENGIKEPEARKYRAM
jgi:hypothetical protein